MIFKPGQVHIRCTAREIRVCLSLPVRCICSARGALGKSWELHRPNEFAMRPAAAGSMPRICGRYIAHRDGWHDDRQIRVCSSRSLHVYVASRESRVYARLSFPLICVPLRAWKILFVYIKEMYRNLSVIQKFCSSLKKPWRSTGILIAKIHV